MNLTTIIIISFSLSADAFAVAIANGINLKFNKIKHAFRTALFFGFFQGFMPFLGWVSGKTIKLYVEKYSHIIAFLLLTYVGSVMIYEALKIQPTKNDCKVLKLKTLTILSIATSIDALAIGVTFALINVSIIQPIIIIGIITFIVSLIGIYIGNKFGCIFKNNFEILAGLILILIGIKILFKITFL